MTKTTKKLILLFTLIASIKIIISFFMNGSYFYSDEACVVIQSKHFTETLELSKCNEISKAPSGTQMPFFPVLLAPLALFFKGYNFYLAILIFHSISIASLVFPLFWIIKQFLKKEWQIFLIIISVLFLPQITIYEKMILTESFFVTINIWLLYFYGKYKTENKKIHILPTIILAIFAGLQRPFGFIVSLGIMINEIVTAKNKTKPLLIFVPITLLLFTITIITLGNIGKLITDLISIFLNTNNITSALIALKNQTNSLIVTSLFIPIIVFISNFNNKNIIFFNKIKYYLVTIIILNFLISTNHLYQYIINGQTSDLLTRYINISIIFLVLFSLIFLFKNRNIKINKTISISSIILIISLIFLNSSNVKHSLNMDLSLFYSSNGSNAGNVVSEKEIMKTFFFPIIITFFGFYIFDKKKTLISAYIILMLIWGSTNYYWNIKYSYNQNENFPVKAYFRNTEFNLIYLQPEGTRIMAFFIWDQHTLTNNTLDNYYLDAYKGKYDEINFYTPNKIDFLNKYDFIITQTILNLPIKKIFENSFIIYYPPQGNSLEEHMEILKSENKEFIEPKIKASLNPEKNEKE